MKIIIPPTQVLVLPTQTHEKIISALSKRKKGSLNLENTTLY